MNDSILLRIVVCLFLIRNINVAMSAEMCTSDNQRQTGGQSEASNEP